jgi:tetratricopeptide (TPR) repeat protein
MWVRALFAASLASGVLASVAHAKPIDAQLADLEARVWSADDYDLPAVEREVVRMIQVDPRSAYAHQLLSHILVRFFTRDPGDLYVLKQASDLAQQAIDLDPKADSGYVAMADIMDLMGNPERGLALLDEAAAAGAEPSWRFYFTRSRLVSDDTDVKKVLGLLETALGFQDGDRRVIVPYVVALLQSQHQGEQLAAALADWQRRFPSPLFELTLAITETDLGRYKQAAALYTNILKHEPKNKEAMVNHAILLYRHLGDAGRAIALFEDVILAHTHDLTASTKAMVFAHLGAARLKRGDAKQAESEFFAAVKADGENLGIIDFVTKVYREHKAHKQLVSFIRLVNDQIGGNGVLHALLGETLSEELAKHDEAVRAFTDAITLDPDRSDYYNGLGLTYYRQKDYAQALKHFVAASEVDPNDATARYNEACVLALLERSDEAVATLAEALTLDPRLTKNARTDADFAKIKGNGRFKELVEQPSVLEDEVLSH